METDVVSGITAYGAAYIDDSMKDLEQVVGLQTDKPLKRAFMLTATNQARSFMKFSLNITKHITRVYSTSTHQRC